MPIKHEITIEQFNELSTKAQNRFRKWWDSKGYHYAFKDQGWGIEVPQPSIGQMIEFLWEHEKEADMFDEPVIHLPTVMEAWVNAEKLCDDLWKEVKEVLDK